MKAVNSSIISKEEAEALVSKVLSLESHWVSRNTYYGGVEVSASFPDFWTLGAAAYLDGPSAHTSQKTSVVSENFSGILAKVVEALSTMLDTEVFIDPKYSSPGFHIFKGREGMPYGTAFGGALHKDYPHLTSEFPFSFDRDRPVTFTLVLSLPKNGGGMNYWIEDAQSEQFIKGMKEVSATYPNMPMVAQEWVKVNRNYLEYKIGTLYVHDGQTLHQVANEVPTFASDTRITLQGHGVYREEGLMIYL